MVFISDVKYYDVQNVIPLHQSSLLIKRTFFISITGISSALNLLKDKI